jgi:hypothetical protein
MKKHVFDANKRMQQNEFETKKVCFTFNLIVKSIGSSMCVLQANRSIAVEQRKITDEVSRMESDIALHAWKSNIKQRALKRQIDVEQVSFNYANGLNYAYVHFLLFAMTRFFQIKCGMNSPKRKVVWFNYSNRFVQLNVTLM